MKYFPAPEVGSIAENLIGKYHKHLDGVRIDYLFSEETPKRGGKDEWGSLRKVSSLSAYLGAEKHDQERGVNDPFFVLTISQPIWDKLNTKQRTALVDHELCHGAVEIEEDTGESKLGTIPHDVEEFRCIVERYGLWRPDLKQFVDSANNPKVTKGKLDNCDDEKQDEEEVN